MNREHAAALREPFPPEQIGKLPRVTCKACRDSESRVCSKHSKSECQVCGNWITGAHIHLDYVGHAEATDRLLQVDPEWSWEPVAFTVDGGPLISKRGKQAVMWIRLTIAGTTRLGVGIVDDFKAELEKELISDALRNAAMRFGVALDLWAKSELHPEPELPPAEPTASKAAVDQLRKVIDTLPDQARTEFLRWKDEQNYAWPWTVAAWEEMAVKAEDLQFVGDGGESGAASPETGDPTTPAVSPPADTPDLSEFSDEPFVFGTSADADA